MLGLAAVAVIACNSGDGKARPIPVQVPPVTPPAAADSPSTASAATAVRPSDPALTTTPGPVTQSSGTPFPGLKSWDDLSPGSIITIAGSGEIGDGAPAKNARLSFPWGVAVDSTGNLFIADTPNHRIRRVDAVTWHISTVTGTGQRGFSGDGGPAVQAQLDSPRGLVMDVDGNLLIADTRNQRIRKVQAGTGIITTAGVTADPVAGSANGRFFRGIPSEPSGVAVGKDGGVFVADPARHHVLRLDLRTGDSAIVAGGGRAGFVGDGGLATNALLSGPTGVAVDSTGNLFIADSRNHRIRRLDRSTGVITTVAGTGNPGFSGDGGPGVLAWLNGPSGVAVDQDQNLLIADSHNKRIRRVDAKTGIIATVAGTGKAGFSGDGGLATAARLDAPTGVAVDARGNLYIADLFNRRIRRVDASTGIMTTVPAFAEEGVEGGLVSPRGIAVDQERNLFIADQGDHRIRRIDAITGMMTTVAGDAQKGFAGDGAPATGARLSSPRGVAVDAAGNLFIADSENHGIRAVKAP